MQTPVQEGIDDEQTYAVIGAAMEVHRRLGPGFLYLRATGYHRALLINFGEDSLRHRRFLNKYVKSVQSA